MLTPLQAAEYSGLRVVSVAEFTAAFRALGYMLDRSMDCRSVARFMSSGETYLACSVYPREENSGLSAWNIGARRDANYRDMQKLRREIAAISKNYLMEV